LEADELEGLWKFQSPFKGAIFVDLLHPIQENGFVEYFE
jgi:hypothetical protein